MDRLAINPIDMMKTVYDHALSKAQETDSDHAASAFLAVAGQMANNLANYRYPKLSALAVKDMTENSSGSKPITTKEAVAIIAQDPFSKSTEEIIDQIGSPSVIQALPKGSE